MAGSETVKTGFLVTRPNHDLRSSDIKNPKTTNQCLLMVPHILKKAFSMPARDFLLGNAISININHVLA